MECSAKTQANVKQCFRELTMKVYMPSAACFCFVLWVLIFFLSDLASFFTSQYIFFLALLLGRTMKVEGLPLFRIFTDVLVTESLTTVVYVAWQILEVPSLMEKGSTPVKNLILKQKQVKEDKNDNCCSS